MKYIDAEKLKKEIENLKIDFIKFHTGIDPELVKSYLGYRSYDNVLSLIDSLQQERPSLPPNLDETAEKYAQKEYPDEPSCGQWGTGDYEPPVDMEYPREIAKDAFKAGAEWMARQMKQEQPEADLDREITHIWGKCAAEPKDQIACLHIESFIEIARHFYELGKNSK